ncbi:MAG: zinc ribbon domain-containing protein [Deltaproteobacteria bacterium]|nr:zinc ribbon domain-containing protein [Deltaproteobacteria bacterium]
MECPSCHFPNPEGMQFCGQCGSKVDVACPKCGFSNPPGFLFCGKCGRALDPGLEGGGRETWSIAST